MSALNQVQLQSVAQWFAAGATLDEIQKRIKSEFDVHMTYLDLRLLVADLPQPVEPEPPVIEETAPADDSMGTDHAASDAPNADPADSAPQKRYNLDEPEEGEASANVTVELDALTIPGTFASGDVTFTDGTKGKWYLDQQGRLGLGNVPDGYRPSPADAALFQARLMELLRSRGMM